MDDMDEQSKKELAKTKDDSLRCVIFVPEGTRAIKQIPLPFIEGSFKDKLIAILAGSSDLMEVTDNEYDVLRLTLPLCDIKYKILLGIPGVNSPRSFLAEDNYSVIVSYSSLEFTPEKEENKFIKELESQSFNEDDESSFRD